MSKTIKTAVAISYAACHLKNFDVEVSLRGTYTAAGQNRGSEKPVLAYIFNSKTHSAKELNRFSSLKTSGMTPEGICLDLIDLPTPNYFTEVYLLNISDGLPNINNMKYNFGTAINHTKKVVSSYKKEGIGVLSYFIHDTWDKGQKGEDSFKKMYGKTAKFIDVENTSQVAKTINNLLLNNTIKVF